MPKRTNSARTNLPPSLADPALPLPKLFVFDLDYTLWPFWVDTHVWGTLKANDDHTAATDRRGESFAFYRDVSSILLSLPSAGDEGIRLAVASRTSAPARARELLKLLHLDAGDASKPRRALDVFDAGTEIYPSSKIRHFEALQKRTGIAYEDMLFFDDESRNRDTETLGVTMWLVPDGVSWPEIEKGVAEWRRRRGHSS
ncbi:magnesium dependent phosphatase [Stachybotrys elegans]|uniref:Magnesium dependent phosphatase n=1 Tax=Stachybotrys elegans TaxID=80388 RepID=A0A8K0T225_9HYPO|nr:magnesium dependent phosphatase [Stachybotrys elegans]